MTSKVKKHRTIFISDVHLGTRGCQAERLLHFLRYNDAETIYLVGDMVDCWRLKRQWYWPQTHNDVVQKLLRKVRKGARLIYVPGNHDEALRDYCGTHFGGVEVMLDAVHTTADGRRLLIIHGDAFDSVVRYAKWLALLGDWAYVTLLRINTLFNHARRRLGLPYWSLSAYLKLKVKNAVQFIDDYEQAVSEEARRRGVQGVVCGHIHHAEMRQIGDLLYVNDGDWVESCTAVVEDFEGRLRILYWDKIPAVELAAALDPEAESDTAASPAAA